MPRAQANLVSVLYHALEGAETVQRYLDDTKRAGDRDLVRFLRQVHRQDVQRAEKAKELFAQHLQ